MTDADWKELQRDMEREEMITAAVETLAARLAPVIGRDQ